MTYVTCRCGHGFETRATCGRTSCPVCKKAVSVPRPYSQPVSQSKEEYGDVDGEEATGGGRGAAVAFGVLLLVIGAATLRSWQKTEVAERRRQKAALGCGELLLGGLLLYGASQSRFWSEER